MAQKPIIALSVAAGIAGAAVLLYVASTGEFAEPPRATSDPAMDRENQVIEKNQSLPEQAPVPLLNQDSSSQLTSIENNNNNDNNSTAN